ncbi:AMP-binding protein, partial [Micromonospora sp. WMMD736]|uniref:AMP-binding protein n=1 Tax=Micromonospora sp. WMMD736 TaxID=3404112 RepID=UPI003B925D55
MISAWQPEQLAEIHRSRTVPARLHHWATAQPDRPFFKCTTEWLTFGQVDAITDALAAGLQGRGINPSDRVAVMLPTCDEALLSVLALAKLGAIQVPINPYLKGDFLRHQLADSQARCIITDATGLSQTSSVRCELPELTEVVGVDATDTTDTIPFDELRTSTEHFAPPALQPRDTMAIMYTSGTTGLPKGCVLSQGYYTALPRGWFESGWYQPDERLITALPLFHIAGQGMTLMAALQGGLPTTFLPAFSASGFIGQCRDAKATAAFGVGPMGMTILSTPPSPEDTAHELRTAIFVPMPPEAQRSFRNRFGVDVVSEVYGQTECNPITLNTVEAHGTRPGRLGKPAPWIDVRLVDDQEVPVPDGQPGEIVIRPTEPMVMFDGYWHNAEATVEASRDLWHHTGDMAVREPDGTLVYFDRKRDAVRRRGENISCVEVEAAIGKHPKIRAVAAHAVAADLGEDDLKVWIAMVTGETFSPSELFEFLTEELPYFAVPRYVDFIDELPVNPLNRVQKFKLRDRGNHGA